MGDIQRRPDDEAWDKRMERRISNTNQAIERGVKGQALAELHGVHVPPDNKPPYDVDDRSHVDDQETLRGKIVSRLIQIERYGFEQSGSARRCEAKVDCHRAGVLSERSEQRYSAVRSQM